MSKHSSAQFTPATPPPTTTTSCCSSLVIRASVRSPAPDRVEWRPEVQDQAVDPQRGELGARRRVGVEPWLVERRVHGDEKAGGIAAGARARVAGRPDQLTQSRMRRLETLIPSPTRPASSAIFGPKAAITTGGAGSGLQEPRRTPEAPHLLHARLHLRPAHGIGRDGAPDRRLLSLERHAGATTRAETQQETPPETSCRVAAIVASRAGSRLATFNTSGPTLTSGVETAIAVNVVQHSSTRVAPNTRPSR